MLDLVIILILIVAFRKRLNHFVKSWLPKRLFGKGEQVA